jgi:hypothetical protein
LLVITGRLLVAALPLPGQAQIAERACLAETVADGTVDGGGFLLVAGGLLVAAPFRLTKAEKTWSANSRSVRVGCAARDLNPEPAD